MAEPRHRVVFLERDTIRASLRRASFEHDWIDHPRTRVEDMLERLSDASIAVVNKLPMPGALLDQLPKLQLIAVVATGTDRIDFEACRRRGVAVSNIPGYASHTVPEHAIMLMLTLRRQLIAYRRDVRAGRWEKSPTFCLLDPPISDLHGSTLALIGRGSLGQGTARLAAAFGMRILWSERKGAAVIRDGHVPFETALAEADVLSLHCPLTPETRGMLGEAELRAMKRDAILINTARGGIVDERALVVALTQGWIAGAGLDVLSVEPPREGNPLLAEEVLALPNFILTPHVGWASGEAMQILADQLVDNIEAFVRGEQRNRLA